MTATPHVNKATLCGNCDHRYGMHCESGRTHWDADDHTFCCITQHCVCGPCQCPAFVNPFTGAVTAWKRPTTPETPCATCDHPKQHHCRKGRISIEVDGVPYGCSHYMKSLQANFRSEPCCDSTACAEVLDVEQKIFCRCQRFVSPYTRRRQKRRAEPMNLFEPEDLARAHAHYLQTQAQQQQPRLKTKAEILLEVVRDFPDSTVTELAIAAERSKSWVRKHLRAANITLATQRRKKGRR